MSRQSEAKQAVRSFIESSFFPPPDLGDASSLLETGTIDSTGVLELIAFLEGHFGLEVDDREIHPDNFDSIDKIDRYVARKLGGPRSTQVTLAP